MKNIALLSLLTSLAFGTILYGDLKKISFEAYLSSFDYQERVEMKINSFELSLMLEEGTAQLIDIRFKEEYEAWHMKASINIPLNELPKRLSELNRNKLIVTSCPHKDRSIMARTYLKLKGYKTRYLSDGLIGLADSAKEFIQEYNLKKSIN